MNIDEAGTVARLKEYRATINAIGHEHDGRVVGTAGDGVLLEFPSVLEAMNFAMRVQSAVAETNVDVPEDRQMLFRIGINLGDVIVEDDDIFGDGVNVAARLETLCVPGGVALSDHVYRQIQDKVDVVLRDGGIHQVKNIVRPVQVWHWTADSDAEAGSNARPPTLQAPHDRPSVAVLPFQNLSEDPEQEYFADGITEDLITALTKFRWFFVVARNSTFTYKNKSVSVREVATDLGVRYVLEGSVRKVGNRVRITGQLIDGQTGNHVWAQRYDRQIEDIFELQDELTVTLVGEIEPELSEAERARAKSNPPENVDAWNFYQRGQWHYWRWSKADAEEAEQLYLKAIDMDPAFSPAYSSLALVQLVYVLNGWTDTPKEKIAQARRSALQAITLDDKDALAHYGLGRVYTFTGDYSAAIAEFEKSLELNPSLARGHFGLGLALHWSGQAEEAITHYKWSLRQNPNDPLRWAVESAVGGCYFHIGELEQSMHWYRAATRHPSCTSMAHVALAAICIRLGLHDEALTEIATARRKHPEVTVSVVSSMLSGLHSDYKNDFLEALRATSLPE